VTWSSTGRRRPAGRVPPLVVGLVLGLAALASPASAFAGVVHPNPAARAGTAVSAVAGSAGACKDADGVTVVVDFTELAGPVVERCAGWPVSNGLDALAKAGFSVTQPSRTPGFVCRLQGRPAATETLHTASDPTYHEECVNTPPTDAYWSYWYAPNGGRWTYATTGASGRQPVRGGFEGWSFALNHAAGAVPAPRATPRHAVPPPPAPPTSTPPTSHPPTSHPPTSRPPASPAGRPSVLPPPTLRSPTSPSAGVTRPAARTTQPHRHPTPHRPRNSPAPAAAGPTTEVPARATTTGALPAEPKHDTGSPLATIAGLCLVGLLAAVGALTAWRRRAGDR
jgi:hypothetical protein